MDINELEREYKIASEGATLSEDEQVRRNMKFIKMLLSENSPEFVTYHYTLLKRREYKDLYYDIRAAMKKRPQIEMFLMGKYNTETDPVTLGDILHLLGRIRSPHAEPMARDFLTHENKYQREVAIYVIGWVGLEDDIALLLDHMLNEKDPHLRITAASAHRQIAWHHTELKDAVLRSLKIGFEKEQDDEVLSWIIVMIGTVAVKKLGLREDKDDPYILHGDLEKAKKKTAEFLATLDFEKS